MSFADDIVPDNASSAIIRKAVTDQSLAAITIFPVELYFGSLVIGEDQLNRDFSVTNTGKKAFRINDVSIQGDDQFQLIGMFPTILKVGESFSMTVQYTSQLLGMAVGSILVYTSLKEEPYTIGLSGRVIGSLYLEAIQDDFTARITEESIVRANADMAEAIHRLTLEATLGDEITAKVTQEQIARVTRDEALAASIEALSVQFNTDLNTVEASIIEESQVRATADEAEAIHRLELHATITDETGVFINSAITSEQIARSNADGALAERIDNIEADYVGADYVTAQIHQEAVARADADSALSSLTTDLSARITELEDGDGTAFDEVYAAITAEQTARVDADEAMASDIETLTASYTTGLSDVNARIDEEITTRSTADEAIATTYESLDARMTTIESTFVDGDIDLSSLTAAITTEQLARIAADSALALRTTTLETASTQTIRIFRQTSDPGTPHRTGDLWYNTTAGQNNKCQRWSGTAWEDCTDPRIGTTASALVTTNANITAEQTARANADTALASEIDSITAQLQISTPTNLLINPGFDFGSDPLSQYWALSISPSTTAVASRVASSLDYSGLAQRLTCTGLGVSAIADLTQVANAYAGVKYTLQARVKTSVAGLTAMLITQALSVSNTVLNQDIQEIVTTTGWQQIVLTQPIANPEGTNRVRCYLRIYGTASISSAIVDWDRVMLETGASASVWTGNTVAEVLNVQANIDSETSARVAADGAIASSLSTLTASYNNSAVQASGSMLPSTFLNGFDLWTEARTGSPTTAPTTTHAAVVDDTTFGSCLEITGWTNAGQNILTKGVIVPLPGHTYEIRSRIRLTASSAAASLHCIIAQLTSTYGDGTLITGPVTALTTGDITELVQRFTVPNGWAYKYFRYGVRMNKSGSPIGIRVSSVICVDVTNNVSDYQDLSATISTEATARASGDGANATAINTVSTTVNGHTASINSINTSINGLNLRWGLKLDSNGYVSGVQANNSGTYSDWVFSSAGFKISGVGGAPFTPFIVDTVANKVKMTNVEVDTLKVGSVDTPALATKAVTNTNYTVLTAAATIAHNTTPKAIDCALTTLAGSSVHISAQLWLNPNHGSFFYVDVYRDTTRLLRIDRLQCLTARATWPLEFVDAAPPAGAHNYSIQMVIASGSDQSIGYVYRYMRVTEFKK